MKRAAKTFECFNDIRKYLFEHKVPCLQFIRDDKVEVLYTQMYIDEKDKEIERLNNIIKRFEEDLREVYLTFGEFSEEYTEKKIRELKGDDKELKEEIK